MDFFERITNLNNVNTIETLKSEIDKIYLQFEDYEVHQLCKVYSRNLQVRLSEKHVISKVVNLKTITNIDHEVVIVRYLKNDEINYILADLTFSQFVRNKDELKEPLKSLLFKKYMPLDEKSLHEYLSFYNKDYVYKTIDEIYENILTEKIKI